MRLFGYSLAGFAVGLLSDLTQAAVADGPGIPNKAYAASQVGKPISRIASREGHGSVAMHRGYMVLIYSKDSGLGNGGISFVDISDPSAPKIIHNHDNAQTQDIREPHGWSMSKDIACLQANLGLHFWDFSDITNPKLLSYIKLPDIQISDYDKGMWWTSWQGGYVYGGGSGNGLYIVNAKDPAKPVFVKKMAINSTGGFRIGPTFAIGNLLVISSTDVAGFSTFDIGDPENPKLLGTAKGGISYASMVNGNRIIGAGSESEVGKTFVYDISNPARFVSLGASPNMNDKGGYPMVADGFAFVGFSTKGFAKVDLSKSNFPIVQTGTASVVGGDEDFCTALGNLAFVGSDHPGSSSLIPHQMDPDLQGPKVNMVSPADGAVKQPLTSRVGLTFTDLVEGSSLTTDNFTVRPIGGQPIEGVFTTQSGIVNFSPKDPLMANTTYEVVVKVGGIKDYAGNGVPTPFSSSFSTGTTVSTPTWVQISPMKRMGMPKITLGQWPGIHGTIPTSVLGDYSGPQGRLDLRGSFAPNR